MNLYLRVALGMVLALVLSVVAMRLIVVESVRSKEDVRKQEMASAGARMMADRLRRSDDRAAEMATIPERFRRDMKVVAAGHSDAEGLVGTGPTHVERGDHRYVLIALDGDEVLVLGPMPGFERPDPTEGWIALATALAIVLGTAFLVVVPIGRRMRSLERATQRLRDGDLSARAQITGGGAVASLATNINHMAEEIERLVENQKQLLQAVSHEFRTPTARIRFALEMLETAQSDADRRKRADEIDQNLTELDALVEELLTYVRFDDRGAPELKTEVIDVAPVLEEIVASTAVLGERISVSVVDHDESGVCEIVANRRSFRRVVDNLLRNAIRHADSKVSVEYQRVGEVMLLLVHDDGSGVPNEERDRVWEPFARLDLSRSRDSGGFGLGLAIVRRIMDWHGGAAHVEDSLLGGAMFVTSWPLEPGSVVVDESV